MEHVRLIVFVCGADSGTDLPFVVEPLNDVSPHAQIEGPLIVRAPLVLHPELFSPLDIPVRALQRENRPCRSPAAGVERENLCRVVRIRVLDLKPCFHEMLAVGTQVWSNRLLRV